MHPWREDVEILMQKMGAHPPRASCRGLDNCRNASLILKKSTCRLQKLAEAWGGGHPFISAIACNRPRIASIAESFSQIRGHFPSTGFVAFLTFLPICQELDLFGFGGYATADGHSEWSGHDLGAEHDIEDAIAAGKQPPWSNPHDPDALDWLLAHAAKVQNRR
ncbi:unnamed protein product [Prorocentrum cordatum]|uniref:Uncharacterized protein n=1 Tax=Prorocentrum cordatum TaxID=2364126 RepID=A0ABN9V9W8_9DINO|nr:unnamed protein product [Polarella glacialis]